MNHTLKRGPVSQILALLLAAVGALWAPAALAAFDQKHSVWDGLLKANVVVAPNGAASSVRYAALKSQHDVLQNYLAGVSAVSMQEYATWSRSQQLAFLVNAYNAYTVELILTRYPDLKSIKDLGSFVQSPWKKKFFRLLDQERSLDDLEHSLIRAPGAFDDPRIHVAVVCASVGCPMLRNEAFVPERLDAQLDDALSRFLSDHGRNRFDPATGTLTVSRIFDWYHKDFEQGHRGIDSLPALFARYADVLGSTPSEQAKIRAGRVKIQFLDYDWSLNDAR